jgi:hypothetical protein
MAVNTFPENAPPSIRISREFHSIVTHSKKFGDELSTFLKWRKLKQSLLPCSIAIFGIEHPIFAPKTPPNLQVEL